MESKLGAKLDIYCDNIVHFALFLAIGLGLAKTMDQELYALLGIIAAIGSLLSFFMLNALVTASKSTNAKSSSGKSGKPKPNLTEKMANRDFIHLLFLLALFGRVEIFLWLTAVGVTVFTLFLVFLRIRPSGQGG
jgi:phosphatidylglycerophosphate synthase